MREELGKAVERDLPIFFADITKEAQQNSEKYVVFFFFFLFSFSVFFSLLSNLYFPFSVSTMQSLFIAPLSNISQKTSKMMTNLPLLVLLLFVLF